MSDSTPWRREEDAERQRCIRCWQRSVDAVRVLDVSEDNYYKANYLVEDSDGDTAPFLALCDVVSHLVDEYSIIPEGSIWREGNNVTLYVVEDNNPAASPDEYDDLPDESDEQFIYCLSLNSGHGFVRKSHFVNETGDYPMEAIDWNI